MTRDRRDDWPKIGDSSCTSTVTNCYLQIGDGGGGGVDRVGVLAGVDDLILVGHVVLRWGHRQLTVYCDRDVQCTSSSKPSVEETEMK